MKTDLIYNYIENFIKNQRMLQNIMKIISTMEIFIILSESGISGLISDLDIEKQLLPIFLKY